MQGTRRVLEGGRFAIGGSRGAKHMTSRHIYSDPALVPYVGKIVYFIDDGLKDRIMVHEVTFEVGAPGTRGAGRNRSVTGRFICYACPEKRRVSDI
jgi:hypothetical protein